MRTSCFRRKLSTAKGTADLASRTSGLSNSKSSGGTQENDRKIQDRKSILPQNPSASCPTDLLRTTRRIFCGIRDILFACCHYAPFSSHLS